MEKLQILFPASQLQRLRSIARREDRAVSELVRTAVDQWLERHQEEVGIVREPPPTWSCGEVLQPVEELRDAAWGDRVQP